MTDQSSPRSPADQRTATAAAQRLASHWQCVADQQRADIEALIEAKEKAERNERAAVAGRMKFRAAFRKAREDAREWKALAERRRDELSGVLTDAGALSRRLARADHTLADMVNQYMCFPEGYISHEFMSAQEDAIEYLEDIGWLTGGALERYYWTDAAKEATKDDPPALSVQWYTERQEYLAKIERLTLALDAQAREFEEARADLTRCAAAHQKALEHIEHYGGALTELAMAGNQVANAALGSAPHEDRTRAAWRERNDIRAEAGRLYKALQEIRRDVHFADQTVDSPGKWQALCQEVMQRVDAVLPKAKIGEQEARRLWEAGYPHSRVSSNGNKPEAALQEETRASEEMRAAYLKSSPTLLARCPRCNRPLNNISPGISVIAGGVSVCTTCAGPGEELLRARGI